MRKKTRTALALAAATLAMLSFPLTSARAHEGDHGEAATATATKGAAKAARAADAKLPPGEAAAPARLESSPRHGEYVDVALAGSEKPIRTWVVYPERKDRAPVVIVIHEIFGLSPWIRSVADQLAREGFIAVAPDLLSGLGPNGGGTESVATRDEVVALVRGLTPEMTRARLDAVFDWTARLPAATSRVATMGFCWGGSASFAYAAHQPKLAAAVVYYGTSPGAEELARVEAPVLGLYGGDDARVNATIDPAFKALKARKKFYQANRYAGAGHGFLRQQDGRDGANLKATQQAWPKTIAFLKKNLK